MGKRMPVIFSGHGSPMIALEHNDITEGMRKVGEKVISGYGKPKAILAVSAHWYTRGSWIQTAPVPKQVYDMYGFPKELYEVKYPVKGCLPLTKRVEELLGNTVKEDDSWGIDHGTWTVLIHMFPKADIPVVQLSVDGLAKPSENFEIGKKLSVLRDEGYLIFGSGNVVHNLRRVEWDNEGGTPMTHAFNDYVKKAVAEGNTEALIDYEKGPSASYAVPTPDHYLPILYTRCLQPGLHGDDGICLESLGRYCGLSQYRYSGLSFTTARPIRVISEISGRGVRGSGRCGADAPHF